MHNYLQFKTKPPLETEGRTAYRKPVYATEWKEQSGLEKAKMPVEETLGGKNASGGNAGYVGSLDSRISKMTQPVALLVSDCICRHMLVSML